MKSQTVRKLPVIIAHRGDHTVFPENSLKAFEVAIRNGCDYVEVDLRTTADGHLIVMHDATIDRTTNGKGRVRDLKLKDILKYQVFNRDRTSYHPESVPVFSEVLKICKGRIKIYLDFKEADVQSAWKMIRSNGMDSSLVVYINHQKDYSEWRRVAPQVPLIVSLPDSVRAPLVLEEFLKKVDAEILDGDITKYTTEMIVLAHSLNRKVWLDFQHEGEGPSDWIKGVDLNIDGFQTDQPLALMEWLSKED
ncbi:MAG: glycerophosphodiester phosphodiesterase family protein [Cyclobacteriaceae bacterium]|nr:glycerophosphodiester phosphodiesterase family protein [Cyclobacteriaceae bacterium]